MNRFFKLLFLLHAAAIAAHGLGNPSLAGMDLQRTIAITARMKAYVDEGYISLAWSFFYSGKGSWPNSRRRAEDIEAGKPMRTDSIFQVMSMSKPIAGVAAMILIEEGKLRLSDPAEKYLPEFRGQHILNAKVTENHEEDPCGSGAPLRRLGVLSV